MSIKNDEQICGTILGKTINKITYGSDKLGDYKEPFEDKQHLCIEMTDGTTFDLYVNDYDEIETEVNLPLAVSS